MLSDLKDMGGIVGVAVIAIVAFTGGLLLLLSVLVFNPMCVQYAQLNPSYQIEYKGALLGCMIKLPDGLWISTDRIRYADGQITIDSGK